MALTQLRGLPELLHGLSLKADGTDRSWPEDWAGGASPKPASRSSVLAVTSPHPTALPGAHLPDCTVHFLGRLKDSAAL